MRYSWLRHKPLLEFLSFIAAAGLLAYFSAVELWVPFWMTLAFAAVVSLALNYVSSESFGAELDSLKRKEFALATRFEAVGLESIYLMADSRHQLERNLKTQRLIENGNRFSLLTISAASYIDPAVDRHWEILKRKLDDGCHLRLLLSNPFSVEQQRRNARNHGRPIDTKLNLAVLLRLADRYPNVDIRFTDAHPYCAIFFTETGLTYDPYHLGLVGQRLENKFLCLEYKRTLRPSDSFDHYSLLREHFEHLWVESSYPLQSFVQSNEAHLAEYWGKSVSEGAKRVMITEGEEPHGQSRG